MDIHMAIFLNIRNLNGGVHSHDGLYSDGFSYSNYIYNDCLYTDDDVWNHDDVCNDDGVFYHIGVYNRRGICKFHRLCNCDYDYDWNVYNDGVGGSGGYMNNHGCTSSHGGNDDPYNIIL